MPFAKNTIIRDISWLAFNARVLQEAKDKTNHIYDRIRFLGIFSNNLDEFFRVRVAALNKMVMLGKEAKMHLENNPDKILKKIQQIVMEHQEEFDSTLSSITLELQKSNIYIKTESELNEHQQRFVTNYFDEKVRTETFPIMLESIPQMPLLRDKSIYLACVLGNSVSEFTQRFALIEIPSKTLPRFIILPSEADRTEIILLEDIIRYNLPTLFALFGFDTFQGYIIKVTRDAELEIDNDLNASLLEQLTTGLKNRKKGRATRFVYDRTIQPALLKYMIKRLNLTKKDNLIPGGRIHNFKDFIDFPSAIFRDAKPRRAPFVHPLLKQPVRMLEMLDQRDVMLHFPYHSFDSVIELLREAAIDPLVQSIKITAYRLAKNSKVVNALINAVRNGKTVTVVIELRARFDEEANLNWKSYLEEEGVNVVLGYRDMKVHAKVCLIRKRQGNHTKHYGFVSTGNFNENTAKYYGDHCLMTSDKAILTDIEQLFEFLEHPDATENKLLQCKTLAIAPFNMREYFMGLIERQINARKNGKKASIIIKLNSLVDTPLIEQIYAAAKAKVEIRMVIRGICCAYTQQKSFKDNLSAISILDEYLEHARVFVFSSGRTRQVFISSADWMVRNLSHRVEVACPIFDKQIQQELIDILNIQLSENVKGRILDNELTNRYVERGEGTEEVRSQVAIYNYLRQKDYK
jgi:polyphosphate kinase